MLCNKIVCVDKKPEKEGYLFFGDTGKYHKITKTFFEKFKTLSEVSEANTWFMNEIDYTKDAEGWNRLPENAKRMFVLNISYQTLMDNGVPNIFFPLSEFTSDSWLSYLWGRIGGEENIHKLTYSSGVSQVFKEKADEMLDVVYEDEMLKKRMEKEIEDSEKVLGRLKLEEEKEKIVTALLKNIKDQDTIDAVLKDLNLNTDLEHDDEFKKDLLVLIFRVFLLEGIKFPFSFFVTWTINKAYNNAIQGFSHALKLIAWDEMTVHTTTGKEIIKILSSDVRQGFKHITDSDWWKNKVYEMVKETVDSEIKWSNYLLQDGPIPGYNKKIGEHFIKYWADERLREIGFAPLYNEPKSDIITWYNEYRNLNKSHNSPQESDTLNYQKGKIKNDMNKISELWDKIKTAKSKYIGKKS